MPIKRQIMSYHGTDRVEEILEPEAWYDTHKIIQKCY